MRRMPNTVFVTISRGAIARNILQTAFLDRLVAAGADVVLITPAAADPEFRAAFARPGVSFEPLLPHRWTRRDYFFSGLHKGLVYNETRELVDRYGIYGIELYEKRPNHFKYLWKKAFFVPASRSHLLKRAVRWLDNLLVKPKEYAELFDLRKPAVVFSTNPFEDADTDVLKTARAKGVPTVILPKSWDNLSKMNMRVRPDLLLLWGSTLVPDARRFHDMNEKNIRIVGVPQYDIYDEPGMVVSREEFFHTIGADPMRPLIVFGSEGKISPDDGDTAAILYGMLQALPVAGRPQLFLRPYYALEGEEKKFAALAGKDGVVIDTFFTPRLQFRDRWDWSREHARHYANLMAHMSVMVCSASTLTLDAVYRDKPVINIAFDGKRELPYGESVRRWYDSTHFKAILAYNGTSVVWNPAELQTATISALSDPSRQSSGRAALRAAYCPKIPGGSGKAIADAVLTFLPK